MYHASVSWSERMRKILLKSSQENMGEIYVCYFDEQDFILKHPHISLWFYVVHFSKFTTSLYWFCFRCYSTIGRVEGNDQQLAIGSAECHSKKIVLRQTLHTLGFLNEHSRRDRDDHIKIKFKNILPGRVSLTSSNLHDRVHLTIHK